MKRAISVLPDSSLHKRLFSPASRSAAVLLVAFAMGCVPGKDEGPAPPGFEDDAGTPGRRPSVWWRNPDPGPDPTPEDLAAPADLATVEPAPPADLATVEPAPSADLAAVEPAPDLGTVRDLAPPADLTSPRDLRPPPDLATVPMLRGCRSSLYPSSWAPGYRDQAGRFFHDFSYAGYQYGEPLPSLAGARVFDAVRDYGADPTGATNSCPKIQAALDDAARAGGGVVHLAAGLYKCQPPTTDVAGQIQGRLWIRGSNVVLRGDGP